MGTKYDLFSHQIVVCLCWVICLGIMAAVIFGMIPLQVAGHTVNHPEDTVYNAFSKTGWALSIVWIAIACSHGYGGTFKFFIFPIYFR